MRQRLQHALANRLAAEATPRPLYHVCVCMYVRTAARLLGAREIDERALLRGSLRTRRLSARARGGRGEGEEQHSRTLGEVRRVVGMDGCMYCVDGSPQSRQ